MNMADTAPGDRGWDRQRVPRIRGEEAARIFAQCERLLGSSSVFVENLRQVGFARFRVCLERNAQCFKGSIQLAGRKKPLRHLIGLSEELAASNVSASSGRTLLAASDNRFMWASLAHIHGIPGVPEWADWFAGELDTHKAIIRALGIGCAPVLIKGEKEQFLDWLSWGVESGAIRFPADTGSVRWPSVNLPNIFRPGNES
jgi:hypothetical protein